MMIKLKISSKVLIYFFVVSLIPLIVVNVVLVSSGRSLLLEAATTRQQVIANKTAENVDNYLADKINILIFQSRDYSLKKFIEPDTSQSLAVLMKQDQDLEEVSVLDQKGMEKVAFNKKGKTQALVDRSNTDAYIAVSYLRGKEFVSSVSYNDKGDPLLTIAVPLLRSDSVINISDLASADLGKYSSPEDIQGMIVANYNISDLWQSVLATKIGEGGYAFVVDGLGNLVAHPDKKFLASHQKITSVQSVKNFINGNLETRETVSEVGLRVISTPWKLTQSNWAVIVEEPVSSVYSSINAFIRLSAIIMISAIALSISMSLIFRKQLLDPIKKLSFGAKKLGSGDFSSTIDVNSNDELRELANTFNNMGSNIKHLVSDLKSKNINLVTEQAKLNSILSSVSDGVIALNIKGEIISINPPAAKLVNKLPDELHGKVISNIFPWTHDGQQFNPDLQKQGLSHYPELELAQIQGMSYLDLVVAVIERQDNSDIAAIITIHDLTKSRELDMMKLDFVAIAAHELRTPLTVVRGYLNLINTDSLNQLTIYNVENLQKAIVGTDQLANLINNLLNISRIERGEMDINITKLDLAKLTKTVVDQHESTASMREQNIIFSNNSTHHVYVPGDPSTISEVLNNLIGNALKYTEQRGTVKVNLGVDGDEVRVEVVDSGPGIPPAVRGRLFTKFYRVEKSLVAGNRGTGLGLYISKTIIELHHGKIGLEPFTGSGSTFYFTLPVFDPDKHDQLISKKKESIGIHGWIKKSSSS